MKSFKNYAFITTGVLGLVILIQNAGAVTLRLFFWKVSISSVLLIPMIFLAGMGVGFLLALLKQKNDH